MPLKILLWLFEDILSPFENLFGLSFAYTQLLSEKIEASFYFVDHAYFFAVSTIE